MTLSIEQQLATLFRQAKATHQRTAGDEPHDWAPWYAEYLAPRIERLLGRSLDVEALTDSLRAVDAEQREDTSGIEWPEYYARWLLARFV